MKSKILSFVLALVLIVTSGLSAAQAEPFLPGGWVKAAGNPLLSPGSSGAWDDQWVYAPSVILDGSTYKMWYAASSAASTSRKIGYATSPDGNTWTKVGTTPVLSPGTRRQLGCQRRQFSDGNQRGQHLQNVVHRHGCFRHRAGGLCHFPGWNHLDEIRRQPGADGRRDE